MRCHILQNKNRYIRPISKMLSEMTTFNKDEFNALLLSDFTKKGRSNSINLDNYLDVVNEVKLVEEDNSSLLLNGNQLDYILPSKDFEIHLCGVDINGVYVNFIKELLEKGYVVYLYSDLIKRYRDTENNIKTIKHPNFKYCSHKSVK